MGIMAIGSVVVPVVGVVVVVGVVLASVGVVLPADCDVMPRRNGGGMKTLSDGPVG